MCIFHFSKLSFVPIDQQTPAFRTTVNRRRRRDAMLYSRLTDAASTTSGLKLAPYLSTVKIFKNRRVVSRFRCGCHGFHADTGEFKPIGQKVDRGQRFCLVCASD